MNSWSASVLAQPDLARERRKSDSQFDSYYDAINSSEWFLRNRSQTPLHDFPALPSPATMRH